MYACVGCPLDGRTWFYCAMSQRRVSTWIISWKMNMIRNYPSLLRCEVKYCIHYMDALYLLISSIRWKWQHKNGSLNHKIILLERRTHHNSVIVYSEDIRKQSCIQCIDITPFEQQSNRSFLFLFKGLSVHLSRGEHSVVNQTNWKFWQIYVTGDW